MAFVTSLISPPLTGIRALVRDVREVHAAHRELERELGTYTSQGDLNDFDAILDRYSDAETAEIRRILAARRYN
ncbi:MAG TPA: hypothetical protein VG164_15205 [Trebonia sp.]|jgi:hypothetical protein|nr:hypothetical protein [Trebonia sp.]